MRCGTENESSLAPAGMVDAVVNVLAQSLLAGAGLDIVQDPPGTFVISAAPTAEPVASWWAAHNALAAQVAALGGGTGGGLTVVDNGDGTLTIGGTTAIDNLDGTLTLTGA